MGYETALSLLKEGMVVYGAARRIERMKKLEEAGVHILSLDVTKEASMEKCVTYILEKEGHIDILVNNAGYGSYGAVEDIPMEEVKRQFDVNVFGLGRMTQLVLPSMRKRNYGKIVNIASMGGRLTAPYGTWYHAIKYAVEAFSDGLRMDLKPYNIDVIVIEPGKIAKVITKAVKKRRPKTRYLVGSFAKPYVLLKRITTDRLFDRLTFSFMGLTNRT